jgi:negative regulator of flagellin synthesis FlgM
MDFTLPKNDHTEDLANTAPINAIGHRIDAASDRVAEDILDNMNNTPVGRLLKVISNLPEIRHEKVAQIRFELDKGDYDIDNHLDVAMDIILEELLA